MRNKNNQKSNLVSGDYEAIIEKLYKSGITFTTEWQKPVGSDQVLLRHDIDFDVECALEIGKIEAKLGVTSTYFFMTTSPFYSITHPKVIDNLFELIGMGHKISIHHDPSILSTSSSKRLIDDIELFRFLFGLDVDIISLHKPGDFLRDNNRLIAGMPHTYMDKYFRGISYISDSNGRDPLNRISEYLDNDFDRKGLQLLIHPIWWVNRRSDPKLRLTEFSKELGLRLNDEIGYICDIYNRY